MRHNVPLSYRRQTVLSSLRSGFRPRPMARISSEPQAQISSPVRAISSAAGRFRYPIEPCTSSSQSMGKREPLVKRGTISPLGASSAAQSTPTLVVAPPRATGCRPPGSEFRALRAPVWALQIPICRALFSIFGTRVLLTRCKVHNA